ncbi:MAG: ethanolamine ammonia-lyase [Ruminococcaceae bacterium]|nr:ethanolamine ammonia-lyase [Oscillospiraceae bacterium]
MAQTLLSVGIDVGTTTTQLVFSRLKVQNMASGFSVPEFRITEKEAIFRSRIHFTPLRSADTIDADSLRQIVRQAYDQAHIHPEDIQTGAVIITGETARKENAEAIVHALADMAGSFVVATAGPALEGILAARGAGADELSKRSSLPVVHLDIGGGTANLTCWQNGECTSTGCYNVGGRLLKFNCNAAVIYRSPVLDGFCDLSVGDQATEDKLKPIMSLLVGVLEEAVGLKERTHLSDAFVTDHHITLPAGPIQLSFSGGVADLIYEDAPPHWLRFEDNGVLLGKAIRQSSLMQVPNRKGEETIRATVMGAGSHSMELSGSTVFNRNAPLPQRDLPVVMIRNEETLQSLPAALSQYEHARAAVYLDWRLSTDFASLSTLADNLKAALSAQEQSILILRQDLAKALGFLLSARMQDKPLLCLDSLSIPEGSYLDIGKAVQGAYPVVIKTLIFSH